MLLQACGQTTDKAYALMLKGLYSNSIPTIKPNELQAILSSDEKRTLLLDTRQPEEYGVSHIAGAQFVGYDSFEVEQLKGVAKDTPVILYCSVGYRSEKIGDKLQEAGFTNVRHLYGGIFEWVNQGLPVYNQKEKTNKIHAFSKSWGVWLQKGEKVYGTE
ncbi:rhodanese-like domain-containing protein [Pontibacter korlensis]|nr:rhodanese-like domain-containing protein [Pontibacter korlensis]